MLRRTSRRRPIPRLSHEEVVERFVDYHFGRLSPELNKAVETHVRSCRRCKREGLRNAAAQRQSAARKLRRARSSKLISPRMRLVLLALVVLATLQFVLYQVARGHAEPLTALVSQWGSVGVVPENNAPPISISTTSHFPSATTAATAIALSMDGKTLAVSQGGKHPSVTLWDVSSESRTAFPTWSGADTPASLAWSEDDRYLAIASASQVVIWGVKSSSVVWQFTLPATSAARVYDVNAQTIVDKPDPATMLGGSPLAWGPDGSLIAAPAGATGSTGITSPQSPIIGLWSTQGVHLFRSSTAIQVGVSSADAKQGISLLDWSPDSRYLLWASLDKTVTSHSGAATTPPDSVVQLIASRIAKAGGAADALLWFGPQGAHVATCDRSQSGTHIQIYAIATERVVASLAESCDGLSAHSVQWSADGKLLYIAPAEAAVETYALKGL